jgi:peptidoglycan-associated lipoprotein
MTSRALAVSAAAIVILAAGCAKTPATSTATAPAPTGVTGVGPAANRTGPGGATRSAAVTNNTTQGRADMQGFKAIADLRDVHFDFDKYAIRPDAAKMLDANAKWLRDNRGHLVLIEGHCDERGTVEYNLALGERRAKATQNYLAAHGVESSRISIVSYGKERPQCTDGSEECWAKNRRAHFLVKPQ